MIVKTLKDIVNYTISRNNSIKDALIRLEEKSPDLTLFVLDDNNSLVGTLTDGNIRRGLIQGLSLLDKVESYMNKKFYFLADGKIDVNYVKEAQLHGVKLIPLVNSQMQIEKIFNLNKLKSILPVDAVLMAGGRGERLRPLTDNTPKSLLKIGEKPIIEYNIDNLISYGIENIYISIKYLGNQIKDYFGDGSKKGINIRYIEENEPLGTIGAISLIEKVENETLLIMNSDLFTNINFEDMFLTLQENSADMVVATIPYTVSIPFAILDLNGNDIMSFKEKPTNTHYANAGIYLFKSKLKEKISINKRFDATDFMDFLIKSGYKVVHNPIVGYWIDIGRYDDFNKANEVIKHIK
jgi:Nucleoside-diphosphate-sugar pyrophosphorylase involved in lipopolysaccharide biosynthesis/translation initiation factor 2B, gamma/epsilon subunits (eIF-2Bgamma/eIF-2Bepsilon)